LLNGGCLFTVNDSSDAVDVMPGDTVCSTAGGSCTLRAAIQEANALPGINTIAVPSAKFKIRIPGQGEDQSATGDLDITDDLIIGGPAGVPNVSIVDGKHVDRVFDVLGTANVTISDLVIQNGHSDGGGGGIRHHSSGNLTLNRVTMVNNRAGKGSNGGGVV